MKLSTIILAAGTSSRMGRANKLFLEMKGKPIIKWVIDSLSESQADEIIVVASEVSIDQLKEYERSRVKLIENPDYQSGMTSSIQAGVRAAKKSNAVMICLGDLPLIKSKTIHQLIQAYEASPDSIIVPTFQGQKGNPVMFPSELRQTILDHTEPEGCKEIVQTNRDVVKLIEVNDPGILRDIDTTEDYQNINA